jgi:hypothetical protein
MATKATAASEMEVLRKHGVPVELVYEGKSGDYDEVRIAKTNREMANECLMNVVGHSVEIQTHVGGGIGKYTAFSFTLNLDVQGDTLFVVLAKLPEEDSLSPLGFYSTEDEARESIAHKGFVEVR